MTETRERRKQPVRVFAKMEEDPDIAQHGRVFTKPHVVNLILELVGYGGRADLSTKRLLDPGCGDGAFIVEAAKRLLDRTPLEEIDSIRSALLGVETDEDAADECEARLSSLLTERGVNRQRSKRIAAGWIHRGDFLLWDSQGQFDFIVGNPPYVRQEAIPKKLLEQYRERYECFFDRADLYMGFIERGLRLLNSTGVLGFICPNRFTRNRYGQKIRRLISEEFQIRQVIDLSDASPFDQEVLAYPGIYIVGRGKTKAIRFVRMATASESECCEAEWVLKGKPTRKPQRVLAHDYSSWFEGDAPWITESPEHLAVLNRLEAKFPALGSETSATSVGIGVASGADAVFLVDRECDEVERELLVPLAITRDCVDGRVKWSGVSIINPFASEKDSTLIDLNRYPKAKRYFEGHADQLQGRNVAKRAKGNWFRTIDRIYPSLRRTEKLLIPDIKSNNDIIYEDGKLYPHHNLYYVVSDYWDMQALRSVLRSSIAKFFVWTYGVKMRSGWLRFQAQYLRRIRIPLIMQLTDKQTASLAALDQERNIEVVDSVVAGVYRLSSKELQLIQKTVTAPQATESE